MAAIPVPTNKALQSGERARIEAVSRYEFYVLAGADEALSGSEFAEASLMQFHLADKNRSGALTNAELQTFASYQARLSPGV